MTALAYRSASTGPASSGFLPRGCASERLDAEDVSRGGGGGCSSCWTGAVEGRCGGVEEVNLAEKGWSRSAAEEEEEWREGYVSKKKKITCRAMKKILLLLLKARLATTAE